MKTVWPLYEDTPCSKLLYILLVVIQAANSYWSTQEMLTNHQIDRPTPDILVNILLRFFLPAP